MADFNTWLQSNPTPQAQPGYLSRVGQDIGNAFKEGGQTLQDSVNGQNPITSSANIFKDITSAAISPISELPGLKQAGQGFQSVGNAIVNNPVGNKVTDFLSQHVSPTALGTASDLTQGALNTAGLYGATDLVTNHPIFRAKPNLSDSTPAYSKDLVGQNVMNPQGEVVPRVNEGIGLTGNRTVTTSASEAVSDSELAKLSDYPVNGTALEKGQAVDRGIGAEAESMRAGLQAEDKANPLNADAEKVKVSQYVRQSLPQDMLERIGIATPEENMFLKGMSEKAGTPIPKGGQYDLSTPGQIPDFPRTAAGKFYSKVMNALNDYNGTREGKLDLRQTIDQAYKSEGGKYAYGSDNQNALYEVHADMRDALNKDLAETTKNTDTQASLKKQTNLFRAKDVLNEKARNEAASTIGRFYQNHPLLHRLATREFMRTAATATGVGLLTTAITNALKGK